jgi:hypothetical protein
VDGLSEVGDQRTFSWGVVVDEEDTHHVSLPMTSTLTMVLMCDSTVSMRTSNFWMVVTTRTASELAGRECLGRVGFTTVSSTEWSMKYIVNIYLHVS